MRLYVIRHGESENNAKGLWSGWQNPPLTQKGIEDAQRARKLIENVTFDKVYASDLTRAVQTAKEMVPGCMPELTPLLREINVGSLGGNAYTEVVNLYGEALVQHRKEANYVPYGGENAEQLMNRLKEFLHIAQTCEGENVAAFAHAGVLRHMWRIVTGERLVADRVICSNCAVLILDYTNGVWRVHSWINM